VAEADAWLQQLRADPIPELPPFQCGLAGYIGYEYGRRLERIPAPRRDDLQLPDVQLGAYDWVVAWEHERGKGWVVVRADGQMGGSADGRRRLAMVIDRLAKAMPGRSATRHGVPPQIRSGFTRDEYLAAVERVREYILAGDVFQANLSQRFEAPCALEPFELYRRLRAVNPAPFAAYLQGEQFAVASASPERFLQVTSDGAVETRPIKGTRPRGSTPDKDEELAAELMASEKDRAENVMIVDLLRNDLSKVCRPGSVEVPALCALESHPTVHHLVSTVTGVLEPGRTALDLLRAAFPGGSVTGAPKVRAMEIIAELEPVARGVYCGAIGCVSVTGAMDTGIPIRTATLQGGRAWFHAGGGIVADSDPALEYEETLAKAAGIVRALESAP
jgi:para-aminobenzoate synthetase component 1